MMDHSDVTAVILAGGMGTRLRSVIGESQKVVAEVAGRPFLTFLLDQASKFGVSRKVLCTGFQAGQVKAALGKQGQDQALAFSHEAQPLGTAGALRNALSWIETPTVLVLNGDSYFDLDLAAFFEQHAREQTKVSIALARVDDVSRYGQVKVDAAGQVTEFVEKGRLTGPGWINAGIYLMERDVLETIPANRSVSIEKEMFPLWSQAGIYGFSCVGAFLDIGTPESFASANHFFEKLGSQKNR